MLSKIATAGQNDIFELYGQYNGSNSGALKAELEQRGMNLAAQAGRIAAAGGKVLISTALALEFTPFTLNEAVLHPGEDRRNVIYELGQEFNKGVRLGLQGQSGTNVAIMLTSELVENMVNFKEQYGNIVNVTEPVCDVALAPSVELCTTDTLVTGGDVLTYLWADDKHLGPQGHAYIGSLAGSRTRTNPF